VDEGNPNSEYVAKQGGEENAKAANNETVTSGNQPGRRRGAEGGNDRKKRGVPYSTGPE